MASDSAVLDGPEGQQPAADPLWPRQRKDTRLDFYARVVSAAEMEALMGRTALMQRGRDRLRIPRSLASAALVTEFEAPFVEAEWTDLLEPTADDRSRALVEECEHAIWVEKERGNRDVLDEVARQDELEWVLGRRHAGAYRLVISL